MDSDATRHFYDDLAPDYHLIFPDWDAAMAGQGVALNALIAEALGAGRFDVLDCACGIGTQSIALAQLGHRVIGCDISPVAAGRARQEGSRRYAALDVLAADMRHLPFHRASFDVVVCADNAVAHLLTPDGLRRALAQMRRVLRPGGVLVLTVRSDFARETHPVVTPVQLSRTPAGQVVTFQLWDWHADGEHYDMQHVQLHPSGDTYTVRIRRATSWALTRTELTDQLEQTGWRTITWHLPQETGFFQPVVVAR